MSARILYSFVSRWTIHVLSVGASTVSDLLQPNLLVHCFTHRQEVLVRVDVRIVGHVFRMAFGEQRVKVVFFPRVLAHEVVATKEMVDPRLVQTYDDVVQPHPVA